jgi:hypothetical protein
MHTRQLVFFSTNNKLRNNNNPTFDEQAMMEFLCCQWTEYAQIFWDHDINNDDASRGITNLKATNSGNNSKTLRVTIQLNDSLGKARRKLQARSNYSKMIRAWYGMGHDILTHSIGSIKLVRNSTMIVWCLTFSNGTLHQTGQGWKHVDRWEDTLGAQMTVQINLSFRNVT